MEVPPLVEVLAVEVPFVGVPQSIELASKVAYSTDRASKDGSSATLENFVNNVAKDIPSPPSRLGMAVGPMGAGAHGFHT
jgi:hypothetical protein